MRGVANRVVNRLQRGRRGRVLGDPSEIVAHVTDRCTLSCAMCMNAGAGADWPAEGRHQPARDMTFDDVRLLLTRFPGASSICFAGVGEPLLARDIRPMVAEAHARGLRTALITNGTELAAHAEWIASGVLDTLDVSLNAYDGTSMRRVCGRGTRTLDAVVRGIRAVLARRENGGAPAMSASAVLWKGREAEANELIGFAKELGFDDLAFHNLLPSSREGFGTERVLGPEDARWVSGLVDEGRSRGLVVRAPALIDSRALGSACQSPWRVIYVDAAGGVSACFRVEAPSRANGDWRVPGAWNSHYFVRSRAEQRGDAGLRPPSRCEWCVERRGRRL